MKIEKRETIDLKKKYRLSYFLESNFLDFCMNVLLRYKKIIEESLTVSDIIKILLENRDIKDKDSFLNPIHPRDIKVQQVFKKNKLIKKEITEFCDFLAKLREGNKTIVVYTDYDADGITGGAIMWETLYLLGFRVMPYVPDRKKEGYGFSKIGIDNVINVYNPSLIISVDHGISGDKKISYAKNKGVPVVVTDHHMPPKVIPKDALYIFHTDLLSGSSVSYMIAREIFYYFKSKKLITREVISKLEDLFYGDYLGLASIGSVADLVDVRGFTRNIIHFGLQSLNKSRRYGLKELFDEAGIKGREITTYDIGYIIAPRINAVGRIGHAIDGLRLLCTTDGNRAKNLAKKLGSTNKERQEIVEDIMVSLKDKLSEKKNIKKIIILHSKEWHEGIIGLIAGKICEEFYRPCIVMTEVDGFAKGSARSIVGLDITEFLRSLQENLIDVGGHPQASGFTIEKNKIPIFIEEAEKESEKFDDSLFNRKIEVDMELPFRNISIALVKAIKQLAPFGTGNSQPLFYSKVIIKSAKILGKDRRHLSITVSEDKRTYDVIYFNKSDLYFSLSRGQKIGIVYSLDLNTWNGEVSVKLIGREIEV